MSIKYGFKGLYTSFAGFIVAWVIYHMIIFRSERPSNYRDQNTGQFSIGKCLIPFRRAVISAMINGFILLTFNNAAKSGIN